MAGIKSMLGSGIYTLQEAALYARVSPRMITRWLFGGSGGQSVIGPQFNTGEKLVSFLDLVQTLAIREIRIQYRVPLGKFRQAVDIAKSKFGMKYPFAMKHYTWLWGDELVIRPTEKDYIQASGKNRGNRLLPFVETYLENLSFDKSGLANLYNVFKYEQITVQMKPGSRFGEPLLPSGYSAKAIWEAIRIEGGIDQASAAYGIPRQEAVAAYRFFVDYLGKTAA